MSSVDLEVRGTSDQIKLDPDSSSSTLFFIVFTGELSEAPRGSQGQCLAQA